MKPANLEPGIRGNVENLATEPGMPTEKDPPCLSPISGENRIGLSATVPTDDLSDENCLAGHRPCSF
jgi:hypothetical protein